MRGAESLCTWAKTFNEIFFMHTHNSEPEKRTSLEVKSKDVSLRGVMKTKFIQLKLLSHTKAKRSKSSFFCEEMFTKIVFIAPAARTPCGCTFPG